MEKEFLTSGQLYDVVLKHPDHRIVKALPNNKDACTPLRFVPGGTELCFAADLTSTAMHRHAMCIELIDLLGDELPEELDEACVLFLDVGDTDRKYSEKVQKLSIDAEAKWIKLHI